MTILWPNGKTTPPAFSAEGHFGWRNSSAPGASSYHRGLDMYGLGTVHAIADGEVVAAGYGVHGWGGGYQVWIQHDGFFTRSLHMIDGSSPVRVGDRVTAGQVIGREGMTGAYQVHLHLEITPGQWHTANAGQVDPKAWLYEHVNHSAAGGGSSLDDFTEEEMDEIIAKLEWIMAQLGGSSDRGTSARQDIDQLQADVELLNDRAEWLKDRIGGSTSRPTNLSQDVDAIKKAVDA